MRIGRLAEAAAAALARLLPEHAFEVAVRKAVTARTSKMPPSDALRLLFRLDALLYTLQGQKAVEYGGGVHTKHRHTGYHEFFTGRIRQGERVLDVGCGDGSLTVEIAEKAGAYVTGIDIAPENISRASRVNAHPRVRYVTGDAVDGLPDGRFDTVVMSNFLEHIKDRPAFISRVRKSFGPSRFLIRVPLFEREWRVPLKRELGVEWRLDPTHEIEYMSKEFEGELADAGLVITWSDKRWGEIWAEAVPVEEKSA